MTNTISCCTSGTPAQDFYQYHGVFGNMGGLRVYQSSPPPNTPTCGTLLLLPDGFGLARHNLILADSFAQEGWSTVVPDYFEGNALPIQIIRRTPGVAIDDLDWPEEDKRILRNVDIAGWLKEHPHEKINKMIENLVVALQQECTMSPLVGVGYCFGGKHVLRAATLGLRTVVSFHPSYVVREDLDQLNVPVYIGLAEKDDTYPSSFPKDLQVWLAEKSTLPSAVEFYPEMKHGFAARPDTAVEAIKMQYQAAFDRAIEWLNKYM